MVLKHYDFNLKFKWNTPIRKGNEGLSVSFFPNNLLELEEKIKMLDTSRCDVIEDIVIEIYRMNDRLTEMALNKRIIFEILKYATFRFYYENDIISIELDIPFFERESSELYTINAKPFIWQGKRFLAK